MANKPRQQQQMADDDTLTETYTLLTCHLLEKVLCAASL